MAKQKQKQKQRSDHTKSKAPARRNPPPAKRDQATTQGGVARFSAVMEQYEEWSGPIPPPHMLEEFDRIHPGAAEMIIKMAVSQSEHRQHLERIVVEGNDRRASRGLHYGLLAVLAVLGSGMWLVSVGHPGAGATVLGISLPTLATVFIVGKRMNIEELRRKR